MRDLHRGQIKLFLADKLRAGLAKNTVRNIQDALRVMLNAAIEDGLISANPAAKLGRALKFTVSKATRQEEIKAMTKEQRRLFLATALQEAPRYYTLFFVLAGTGMRIGAALALKTEDVDLHGQMIRIARALSEDGELDTPKSGHGRTVDITKSLAGTLSAHNMTRKQDMLKYGWTEVPPWLFDLPPNPWTPG